MGKATRLSSRADALQSSTVDENSFAPIVKS